MRTSLLLIALTACSTVTTTTPRERPGSRGLRADQHLDAAREHERRANELARWPESRTSGSFDVPGSGLWYRAWDTTSDHEHLADSHRSAAAQQHAVYDEACREVGEPAVSPLQRFGIGGSPTTDGSIVFLSPDAGPPDRLLAAMRCHRAWMMLADAGMDECPLDLAGIHIQAHGDASGITIAITVRDKDLVSELQRRIARDLELAAQRRKSATE